MNQRILSCPSALIAKGVTLKARDTENRSTDTSEGITSQVNQQRRASTVSLPKNWKPKNATLSLSSQKLAGIERLSLSSFASSKVDSLLKALPISAQKNATWDDVGVPAKSAGDRMSLFDLASLKTDDPFKTPGVSMNMKSSYETLSTKAVPQGRRLSNLVPLKEESPFKLKPISATKDATWDEKEDDNTIVDASISARNFLNTMKSTSQATGTRISTTFAIKTFAEKPSKQIDVGNMSSSELSTLKQEDAFMYYSIPAVMKANLHGEQVDLSSLKTEGLLSNSSYERKSRISFEAWDVASSAGGNVDDVNYNATPNLRELFYDINADGEDFEDSGDNWLISFLERSEEQ